MFSFPISVCVNVLMEIRFASYCEPMSCGYMLGLISMPPINCHIYMYVCMYISPFPDSGCPCTAFGSD